MKTRFIRLSRYTKYTGKKLFPIPVLYSDILIPNTGKYFGKGTFSFLNIKHTFQDNVDWKFMEYGKLWNYNLQYFDYLLDAGIDSSDKEHLINDFSEKLLSGYVKPEPYPVSLRLVNWLLYYSTSGFNSPVFIKALQYQVDYLENNLEFHIQANHLLENYLSLIFSAMALRDSRLASRSLQSVKLQLDEQVFPDGGHYEGSAMYHSIITGKLLLLVDALDKAEWFTYDYEWLRKKTSAMLGWLASFSFKDGSWACFNDATRSIAPEFNELKIVAEKINVPVRPQKLKDSGYRKIENSNFEVVIDAGNITPSYQPGHAHSDMLSFCLQYKGKPILTDPGISTYESNAQRMWERSTASHNTVTLNGKNQSEIWGSFRVGKRAKAGIQNETEKELMAFHDGYSASDGILHFRKFTLEENHFLVNDELDGSDGSSYPIGFFYLDHKVALNVTDADGTIEINNSLVMHFTGHSRFEVSSYKQAIGFNLLQESKVIKVYFSKSLTTSIYSK